MTNTSVRQVHVYKACGLARKLGQILDAVKEDSHQKTVYCMIPLIQISRIGKSIDTESRLAVVGGCWGEGETVNGSQKIWGFC